MNINDHVIIRKSSYSSRIGKEAVIVAVDPELNAVDIVLVVGNGGVIVSHRDWLELVDHPISGWWGPDGKSKVGGEDLTVQDTEADDYVSISIAEPGEQGPAVFKESVKDGNPKDSIGVTKPSTHFIPRPVLYEVGNVLFSGARKYGAFNWRVAGVRASVYQDAAGRHIDAWQEGQDLDPESRIHHLSHAIAGLMIIRDAMICDKFVDDRPPSAPEDWMKKAQAQTGAIIERQPNSVDPYIQVAKDNGDYDRIL